MTTSHEKAVAELLAMVKPVAPCLPAGVGDLRFCFSTNIADLSTVGPPTLEARAPSAVSSPVELADDLPVLYWAEK